jgi:hypothetical protein
MTVMVATVQHKGSGMGGGAEYLAWRDSDLPGFKALTLGADEFIIGGSKKEVHDWMKSHQNLKVYSNDELDTEFQARWGEVFDDNAGHVLTQAYAEAAQTIFPSAFSSAAKKLAKKLGRSSAMEYHVTLSNKTRYHRMGSYNNYPIKTTVGAVLMDIQSGRTFIETMTSVNAKLDKVKGKLEA